MSDAGIPSVEAYLARLPEGLASYPAYQQKGSVFREFLKGVQFASLESRLPAALARWVRDPPQVNQWLPEVHANAVFAAVRSEFFDDDTSFEHYAHRRNVSLLSGPLYRILFKLASPERVLRGAEAKWQQFHRGSQLIVLPTDPKRGRLILRCPKEVLTPLLARCHATAFRAALSAAGALNPEVNLVDEQADAFHFEAHWG